MSRISIEYEIAVYDEVVSRFGDQEELPLAEQVAGAELATIETMAETGEMGRAQELARQFVDKFSRRSEPEIQTLVNSARELIE